ncbi:MAG: TolC family protein, partial [Elusimicrobia bacterium]|nr:TolC family protein [Elusimicrobiota bacterium]
IQSARSAVNSAKAKYRGSFSDFLPQVTANGDYSKSNGSGSSPDGEHAYSLTAKQSLFSGFKTQSSVRLTQAQMEMSESELALAESNVLYDLKIAFLNLLYSQENLNLLTKIKERRAENAKLIELRYQAGRENLGSLLRAQAQLAQSEYETEREKREKRTAQKRISQFVPIEPQDTIAVTGNFEVSRPDVEPDFSAILLLTPRYRKEILLRSQAESAIQSARSSYYPDLSLSGSGRKKGKDFFPDSDSWNAGVSVSYPIFSGKKNYYNLRQAELDLEKASFDLENARLDLDLSLEKSYRNLENALDLVRVQKQFLEASETRATVARAQYTNGLVSFQDWDIIENDLISTQKQALTAMKNAAVAEADWLLVQGKGWNDDKK